MSEEKTIRCEIAKGERGWVVNYKDKAGRTAIVAVIGKTESGCRVALFRSGCAEPCVTMETTWAFDGTFIIVRKAIRGIMSKLGKHERARANKRAREEAKATGEGEGKEVAA